MLPSFIRSVTFLILSSLIITGCASLREQLKDDEIPKLTKLAKEISKTEPKPKWETVMQSQEADLIRFIGPDRVLVSEQELIGVDLLLGFEGGKPAYGNLSLYDTNSGERLWKYERKRPTKNEIALLRYALVVTSPSIVIMSSGPKKIVFWAIDRDKGILLWEHEFGTRTAITLSPGGEALIVASSKRRSTTLTAIELKSGAIRWQREDKKLKIAKEKMPVLVTAGNALFFIGNDIHRISTERGDELWRSKAPLGKEQILSVEAQGDDILIFGKAQTKLLDIKSGKSRWGYRPAKGEIKSALLTEDKAYLHTRLSEKDTKKDQIISLNFKNGRKVWSHEVVGEKRSPLLAVESKLYYTSDCCIVALHAKSGKASFKHTVPADFDIARNLGSHDIYLPDLLVFYDNKVIAARETYGVVALSLEKEKILYAQSIPLAWSRDYSFHTQRAALISSYKHFSDLRGEKEKKRKITLKQIDVSTASMVDSFGISIQRIASASAASSQFTSEQARMESRQTTQEISRRMGKDDLSMDELRAMQSRRQLAKETSVMESRGQVASLGTQKAALEVEGTMAGMMASINFWNTVTDTFFGVIAAAQAEMQKSSMSKGQAELNQAIALHRQSLQDGFFIRPFKKEVSLNERSNGVTVVDLRTGKRVDFLYGLLTSDMHYHGLELPSFGLQPDGDMLVTNGIGLDPSKYEKYEIGTYDLPYPSVIAFELSSQSFAKGLANPDLVKASEYDEVEVVKKLIDADTTGKTLKTYGPASLAEAAYNGNAEVVRLLIDKGVNVNAINEKASFSTRKTALNAAAYNRHIKIVRYLIQKGADVNGPEKISSPLDQAAGNGHAEVVRLLLKSGADVNRKGSKPLSYATTDGSIETVKILIEAGADVNAPKGWYNPLSQAEFKKKHCKDPCDKPYDKIIELLIQAGAKKEEKKK